MPHVNIKGVGTAQFPDDMPINDIRAFLQKKFAQNAIAGNSNVLAPAPTTAAPFTPTLTESMGQGVSDFLTDTGIISNRHGAQQIGKNIAAIGEFLPGIGDAAAGDEFGRAVAQGDTAGIALGALSAIPVVGKVAKSAIRNKRVDFLYKDNKTLLNSDNTLSDNYSMGKDDFIDDLSDSDINKLDELENSGWVNAVEVDLNGSDKKRVIDDLNATNLYHGTPEGGIKELELRSNEGLFLTHDRQAAEFYAQGGSIHNQKVNVKNPFFVESTDLTADMENTTIFKELLDKGYDSIVPLDKGDIVLLSKAALEAGQ